MTNELILLFQIIVIAVTAGVSLRLGKEALVAFTVLQMVLANLFVLKQTTLFGLQATTADSFVVGSLLGFNLLQEFFDRRIAKQTIVTTFVLLLFYAIVSRAHLLYIPSSIDVSHPSFVKILSVMPWLVVGSMVIYLIAQVIDFIVYGALQKLFTRWLVIRNYAALFCSQLTDTVLFTLFLMLLGIVKNGVHVVMVSFSIKFLITLIATPLIVAMARQARR